MKILLWYGMIEVVEGEWVELWLPLKAWLKIDVPVMGVIEREEAEAW